MLLEYKDRAKEMLVGEGLELSSPPAGFVELPTDVDFEYAVVCADGQWQTGIGQIYDSGGARSLSLSQTYGNSSGTTSNILSGIDFASNPAEVFCTISATTMNGLSSVLEWVGSGQILTGDTYVYSSSSDSALYQPAWPGHASCPVDYVEYEFRVFASVYGDPPYAKTWVGTATCNGEETPVVAFQNVLGAANTDLAMTPSIDMTSGLPVLKLDYTNSSLTSSYTFRVEVIVRRLVHYSSCW